MKEQKNNDSVFVALVAESADNSQNVQLGLAIGYAVS